MSTDVLIVEDESRLAALLADYCAHAGYVTRHAGSLAQARKLFAETEANVILLDLMLPDGSGLDLCKEIRQTSEVPILILSARVDELDRLLGLELGADDYICKPYSPREVMARIKAVLRRQQAGSGQPACAPTLVPERLALTMDGTEVSLSQVEYSLLDFLARHPGHIRSRSQIMDHIYPDNRVVSDRTIDSHIKKLRQKLGQAFPAWLFIDSVYGAGYRYDPRRHDTDG